MDNYRPISKLCILSKLLEKLVSKQLKQYLNGNNVLSCHQSGFRKGHNTTSAVLKFPNDIVESLDNKQHHRLIRGL
ncbi:MAG: reverse transcriptase domain-containing protein [Plesiomonas shigelloides]